MGSDNNNLTLNELLGSDGFIPFGEEKVNNRISKINIFEKLHQGNPIKKLKEYGFFCERDGNKCGELEYTGTYHIDNNKKLARYLLSRTYNINKTVINNAIVIDNNDIFLTCPVYYIKLYTEDGVPIDEYLYKYRIIFTLALDKTYQIPVMFDNGYIINNQININHTTSKSKLKIYGEIIKKHNSKIHFIMNTYLDKLIINLDNKLKHNKVHVEIKIYDLFAYGGFFDCGWSYST